MTENLDHLLAVDHFLDKALFLTQSLLLPDKVPGRASADFLGNQQHDRHAGYHHQSQPYAVVDHNAEHGQRGNHRGQQLGKALRDHLTQGIDIVGVVAHNIAMVVLIKVFDGQPLHGIEHFLSKLFQGSLGNDRHQLGEHSGGCQGNHIKRS
jgi:broad specificity phosphatase PhoE